ncbi:helix-turn-helix domain-containing protein [Mycobacterium sp. URHD0025]|uniref:helix-turn-helix domain-containing protein n=1 Tax=Mycobacterium sp. URHD0025 TaxID=1298864 RepID=UPI00049217F9|nr:helix-turn-helix domain-containing protein [Mycobacterium sp. URHD0025]
MPPDNENGTAFNPFNPRAFRRSLRRAGITATQYRVAVELCEYASQDRSVVWPSVAVLAEDCELGRSTVIRILGQLESHGIITCDGGRKGGRGCSTRWRLIAKGVTSETLSDLKGLTSGTLSDAKRVPLETKRVPLEAQKGPASETRSSKEEGKKGGRVADATPTTPPPRVSRDSEPEVCCPEHEPPGVENCTACERAWRKHEAWEDVHPQSWAEFAEELLPDFRPEWIAQGPPKFCDRDHGVSAACGTCRDLRLMREEWDKRRAQWKVDCNDWRKAIDGCGRCNSYGRVWVGDDPDPWWCDHGYGPDPQLDYFGTVSSVPPDTCESVSNVGNGGFGVRYGTGSP